MVSDTTMARGTTATTTILITAAAILVAFTEVPLPQHRGTTSGTASIPPVLLVIPVDTDLLTPLRNSRTTFGSKTGTNALTTDSR